MNEQERYIYTEANKLRLFVGQNQGRIDPEKAYAVQGYLNAISRYLTVYDKWEVKYTGGNS
jgi:hypothetical protein